MAINILTEPQDPPISGDYTKDQNIQHSTEQRKLSILDWSGTVTNEPVAVQGAFLSHAGNTFQVQTSNESISGTPAAGLNYIIATESSGVITLAWATSISGYTYNPAYGGWYNSGLQALPDVCYKSGTSYFRGFYSGTNHELLNISNGNVLKLGIGADSLELGVSALASGNSSTAMGLNASAAGDFATALGNNAAAAGVTSTALGRDSTASGSYSTALGNDSDATGFASVALGNDANATALSSTAVGNVTEATADSSTAVGASADATGNDSTAVGAGALASVGSSTAVGHDATASGISSTALGYNSSATGVASTALGYNASSGDNEYVLGGSNINTLRCNTQTISALSDPRDKIDMEKLSVDPISLVKKIKVYQYRWNQREAYTVREEYKDENGKTKTRLKRNKDGSVYYDKEAHEKAEKARTRIHVGFNAMEFEKVIDDRLGIAQRRRHDNPDQIDEISLNQWDITGLLWAICREQQNKIDDLENRISKLEK